MHDQILSVQNIVSTIQSHPVQCDEQAKRDNKNLNTSGKSSDFLPALSNKII